VIAAGPTDYWHDGSFITAAQNMGKSKQS